MKRAVLLVKVTLDAQFKIAFCPFDMGKFNAILELVVMGRATSYSDVPSIAKEIHALLS